ncbi:hypothetical protein QBC38DRAFT_461842 [Podospora fimiseda]|uniref:Uncharacterized protein n=1 Tax=Podospora fimiseda TaxID=252190 RepID=A0AAN7BEM2_9PEZI|nr:hypothetical protein QBC38DRAFT_461842 [Podospora fimiseda]
MSKANINDLYDWGRICRYFCFNTPPSEVTYHAMAMDMVESVVSNGHNDRVLIHEAKKALCMAEESGIMTRTGD